MQHAAERTNGRLTKQYGATTSPSLGIDRADAADQAEGEVVLDAFERGRRGHLQEGGAELQAVGAVVDPGAACLDELAGIDHGGVADHGDQVALTARLHAQDAEPALRVMEVTRSIPSRIRPQRPSVRKRTCGDPYPSRVPAARFPG